MAKTVVMPQMGESVAEGTIVRWLKKVGDSVERDEPLFEISTDKVDAEIPSPSAGVLSEIKVQEGQTVPINTVVGVVDETAKGGETTAGSPKPPAAPAKSASAPSSETASASAQDATADKTADTPAASASAPAATEEPRRDKPIAPRASTSAPAATEALRRDRPVAPAFAPSSQTATAGTPIARSAPGLWSAAEARELRLSPVVRKIARTHHIDVRNIAGSGAGGRVTKNDILAYLDAGAPAFAPSSQTAAAGRPAAPGEILASSASLLGPNPAAIAGLDPSKY